MGCDPLRFLWPDHMRRMSIPQKIFISIQAWFFFWISLCICIHEKLFGQKANLSLADGAKEAHEKRVKHVQEQVEKAKFPLFTARPDYQRVSSRILGKRPGTGIDMSALRHLVAVDFEKGTITAEPGVRMVELSHFLESRGGQILPSVPELDDLTVSGLLMGCGIESTGFKYGMFNECVEAYEILMADRKVHRITKEDKEIFYSLPWSYGTLGLLLSVELKLVPCKSHVLLTMEHVYDREKLCESLTQASNRTDIDFVEALAFSPEHSVVMTGTWTDNKKASSTFWNVGGWNAKWFYQEVKKCKSDTVVMTMTDYIHRHSKGIFWELSYLQPWGNTFWYRWLFGYLSPPKIATCKRFQPSFTLEWFSENHVVQDYLIPLDKLHECLDIGDKELGVYPIWLCPYVNKKHPVDGLMHPHGDQDRMYIDVGYYGLPTPADKPVWLNCDMMELCTKVEDWMIKNDSFVMLYAYHGLDQNSIRKMFCHDTYDKVREKYDTEEVKMYPSILDKVGKKKGMLSKTPKAAKKD